MNKVILYYKPRRAKYREALCLLEKRHIKQEIKVYLKTPPSETEPKVILHKPGLKPLDLILAKRSVFVEKYKGKNYHHAE